MSDKSKIREIQVILEVTPDGIWGPESQAALDELIYDSKNQFLVEHETWASSFADPADIEAFEKCKAQGHSDDYCFQYGDNGIGCYGQSTVEGTGPSCALPPEYTEAKWGSVEAGKNKLVRVILDDGTLKHQVMCVLKDRMPHIENLASEARIDLNPDAVRALGLEPPIMERVKWWWANEENQKGKT
jgi:hypothetical protein